jgi:hypothetical protein
VVDSAELCTQPAQALAGVFSFLGVDDTFWSDEFARPVNETEGLHANRLGRAARWLAFRTIGRYRARAFKARVPQALQRPLLSRLDIPRVSLDPSLRAELEAYFKEDVDRLRTLTGQRFESWSV